MSSVFIARAYTPQKLDESSQVRGEASFAGALHGNTSRALRVAHPGTHR